MLAELVKQKMEYINASRIIFTVVHHLQIIAFPVKEASYEEVISIGT